MNSKARKFGYVSIVGEPNAGKSTLINALLKTKISIVTPKPQTTRFKINGIYVQGESQMVLVDTPGIFGAKSRLEKSMVRAAEDGYRDADLALILLSLDTKDLLPPPIRKFAQGGGFKNVRRIYVLNKLDLAKPNQLELARNEILSIDPDAEIHVISALKNDGVDLLRERVLSLLPDGDWHFPEDQLTDASERLLASEITREQIFLKLSHEVPYGVHVETESWEDFKNGSVKVSQVILLSRESHKPIILGKSGIMIKKIRELAQAQMENTFDRKVHLFLFVKIRPDWAENQSYYKDMGLEFNH